MNQYAEDTLACTCLCQFAGSFQSIHSICDTSKYTDFPFFYSQQIIPRIFNGIPGAF